MFVYSAILKYAGAEICDQDLPLTSAPSPETTYLPGLRESTQTEAHDVTGRKRRFVLQPSAFLLATLPVVCCLSDTTPTSVVPAYAQCITPTTATIMWKTASLERGMLTAVRNGESLVLQEPEPTTHHKVTIKGLAPDESFRIRIHQHPEWDFDVRTAPRRDSTVRFAVIADPQLDSMAGANQIDGMLDALVAQKPEFLIIAGDLVESGGSEDDWALFWSHFNRVARKIPIYACLGNHEYYSGRQHGYDQPYSDRAAAKSRSHFHFSRPDGPQLLLVFLRSLRIYCTRHVQ